MRVLFFLTSLGAGGTERSTAALLPALRDRGVECEVAILKREQVGFERQVRDNGFIVHEVQGRTAIHRMLSMRRLLRARNPDVLHTAIFDADVIGRLAGLRMPVRVVSSLVNTSYGSTRLDDLKVPTWKLRVAQVLDAATARLLTDRLHAVSDGVASANVRDMRLRPENIVVVERGRDPDSLKPSRTDAGERVRAELGVGSATPMVLAIGRVEYQKGHEMLVEALVGESPTSGSEAAVIVIAGRSGNATEALDQRIRELAMGERVRLLGHRSDVADLLVAADVFALPSRYEGTAGVVIEAMAAGTPIVATQVEGLVGVLEHGTNARLAPVGDPNGFKAEIDWCLGGGPEVAAMVERAGDDFRRRFTIDRAAERMVEFYRQVLAG